jgi:Na+-translocating ferredoxin:NAD+ oxidoreductase subunit B
VHETSDDVYEALAHHLDGLPGGYPKTESGVELRILRRLFSPQEAELAVHLTLIPEEAYVIAYRAGLPRQEAASRLGTMAHKGLVFSIHRNDRAPKYQAAQFAVGIWEYQVNRMDEAFVRDMDEYWPTFFNIGSWQAGPQLRTIPIRESVRYSHDIMPYEQAEALIRAHDSIAVAPCVCRQDRTIAGEPCDKPQETCLSFDGGADYYVRDGRGRSVTHEEALEIIELANKAGLVLQPSNSKTASFICCCCGCCCGVLRNLKEQPNPAELVVSAHIATLDPELCIGCGLCLERCQMDALRIAQDKATLNPDRCIGCGLCVTTCPTGALTLTRKPASDQPSIPRTMAHAMLRLAHARGTLGPIDLVKMLVKSGWDRLLGRGVR